MTLEVKINGKFESIAQEGLSVARYLEQKNIHPQTVAVEVNMCVIDKSKYAEHIIQAGDEIEIVKFVGGG